MIALHLLKHCCYLQDAEGRDVELRFFRDVDGREVDFVLLTDRQPSLFVECKFSETGVSSGLRYLKARFPDVPAWQVFMEGTRDYQLPEGIRVCHALHLLNELT